VDPYSSVRYLSQRSLRRLPGYDQFAYDYIGPETGRAQARERALEIWRARVGVRESNAPALPAGELLPENKMAGLLRQRNDRHLELLE